MSPKLRTALLRADAIFLMAAAAGGMRSDILGAFHGAGSLAPVLAGAPHAAIGFVEAHGLAFIIGVLLWRAETARLWHLTSAAVHLLLGIANLVFWQIFITADMLSLGYVTTALHWAFVTLHLLAASVVRPMNV